MSIEILPTIVPSSFDDITLWGARFKDFAAWVQVDLGDGKFVSNTTWVPAEGEMLPHRDALNYEFHLMTQEPRVLGLECIRAGAKRVIGHIETFSDTNGARAALLAWKKAGPVRGAASNGAGAEVGLALLIDTPFARVESLVSACDVILLMSIATLGKQGAPFDERIYERVRQFHALYPSVVIAIDGGVSEKNIAGLVQAGASRFSVGSAIAKAPDPLAAYAHLKALAESALV